MAGITHGGDVRGFVERCGRDVAPLDFSSNVSPLGMSPRARSAARRALAWAERYPDPECRDLTRAIARHEGVDEGRVVCGAGAVDLIYRLAEVLRPRLALVCAPTFSEYRAALERNGAVVASHALDAASGFALDEGIIADVRGDSPSCPCAPDLVVLCEPNNPTGVASSPELLRDIVVTCHETGACLLVDACFDGLADRPFFSRPLEALPFPPDQARPPAGSAGERGGVEGAELGGVVVLKAFTKLHGMAGLRLGYAVCSDARLAAELRAAGRPWAVSCVAQAAGVAALDDTEHVERVRELVARERPGLVRGLESLGLEVFPSVANYLLFRSDCLDLARKLEKHAIMIRDCSDYEGLGHGFYRVAVRTRRDNGRLLAAIRRVLEADDAPAVAGVPTSDEGERAHSRQCGSDGRGGRQSEACQGGVR